eukprot:2326195-Rhodomonas_salina.2
MSGTDPAYPAATRSALGPTTPTPSPSYSPLGNTELPLSPYALRSTTCRIAYGPVLALPRRGEIECIPGTKSTERAEKGV